MSSIHPYTIYTYTPLYNLHSHTIQSLAVPPSTLTLGWSLELTVSQSVQTQLMIWIIPVMQQLCKACDMFLALIFHIVCMSGCIGPSCIARSAKPSRNTAPKFYHSSVPNQKLNSKTPDKSKSFC